MATKAYIGVHNDAESVAEKIKSAYIGVATDGVGGRGINLVDMTAFEFNDTKYTHTFYRNNNAAANELFNIMSKYVGHKVTYSAEVSGGAASGVAVGQMRWYTNSKSLLIANVGYSFTVPDITDVSYVTIYGTSNGASVKNYQIELGSVATEYEPYGCTVARKLKKIYFGDENGIARLCYSAGKYFVPLGSSGLVTVDGKVFSVKEVE